MVRDHVSLMQGRLAAGQTLGDDAFLSESVIRSGGPLPSLSSIKQFLASIPRVGHEMRKGGKARYRRNMRALAPANFATRPNEEWQSDNTLLDITIKAKKKGVWKAVRPFMTASVDAFSRAAPGWVVSTRPPDAWTSVHLLRHAILPDPTTTQSVFGLPERLVMDNGADFTSHRIKVLLAELHTVVDYCDPHVPDQKAEIEAFFGTITRELLPTLPGSTRGQDRGTPWTDARIAGLLTIDQLRDIIDAWINTEYHPRPHSQTGEAPIKRWASAAGLVQPIAEQELDPLLLVSESTRKVVRGMIRFTPSGKRVRRFYAPELHAYTGERVQIRYNPDDLESILVYSASGERLAEAWRMHRQGGRYSYRDVLSDEQRFATEVTARRRDLIEALPDYFANARASDRPEKEDKNAVAPAAASARDGGAEDAAEHIAVQQAADGIRAALRAAPPLPDADRSDPRVNPGALLALFRETA
jgi:putative transposase